MFAYCLNNPICLRDSSGLTPTEAVDSDGDGDIDYYRYEYTYHYVIVVDGYLVGGTRTGNVYYFPDIGDPKNLDESDAPQGFNPLSDIMVGYYVKKEEDHDNPVLYAYQAHRLSIHARGEAIECMLLIDEDFSLGLGRTRGSMLTEWISHMVILGKLGFRRTANIDFDHDAEGLSFGDYVAMAIEEGIKGVSNKIHSITGRS